MQIPDVALKLAGYALVHAGYILANLFKNETLDPFAIIERDGEPDYVNHGGKTPEQAVADGEEAIKQLTSEGTAWAFGREGSIVEYGCATDVLFVKFWAKGMSQPAALVQRFELDEQKNDFKLIGEIEFYYKGPVDDMEAAAPLRQVREGMLSHPFAADLWDFWRSPLLH